MELTLEEVEEKLKVLNKKVTLLSDIRHQIIINSKKEQLKQVLLDALTLDFNGHHLGGLFELQTEKYKIKIELL